jgi:tetratricopeptide (TPR) repeat protein
MSESVAGVKMLRAALLAEEQGELERARDLALQAVSGFGDDRTGAAAAHHLLGVVYAGLEQLDPALSHLETAVTLRTSTGDLQGLAALHQQRFEICAARSDVQGARAAAQDLVNLHAKTFDRAGQAQALHLLAQVLLAEGELTDAQEAIRVGGTLTDKDGEEEGAQAFAALGRRLGEGHIQAAERRLQAGDAAGALHSWTHAARCFGRDGRFELQHEALHAAGQLAAQLGQADRAVELAAEQVMLATRTADQGALATSWFQLGQRQILAADLDAAARAFRESAAAQETLGQPHAQGISLAMLGQVLGAAGHTDDALSALLSAQALLEGTQHAPIVESLLAEVRAS